MFCQANQEHTVYLISETEAENVEEWFEVECHSVVLDTVGREIFDDEI